MGQQLEQDSAEQFFASQASAGVICDIQLVELGWVSYSCTWSLGWDSWEQLANIGITQHQVSLPTALQVAGQSFLKTEQSQVVAFLTQ